MGPYEEDPKLQEFIRLYKQVKDNYVDPISSEELLNSAMKGMVSRLDLYSHVFVGQKEVQEVIGQLRGRNYVGIGISVIVVSGDTYVTEAFEGYAADTSGIKAGDMIVEIEGVVIKGMAENKIRSLISAGEEGTIITIKTRGFQSDTITTHSVIRESVRINSVVYKDLADNISYIKIREFGEEAALQFRTVLTGSANKDGLIIDLRNNLGGFSDIAVEIVSCFIGPNKTAALVAERDRIRKSRLTPQTSVIFPRPPKVVILANKYSASASELMLGSLKYYGLATFIGETTYGKGVFQHRINVNNPQQFPDKHTSLLLDVTAGHYYLPDGTDIHGVGINPDIKVEQPNDFRAYDYLTEKDAQFQAALKFLKNR